MPPRVELVPPVAREPVAVEAVVEATRVEAALVADLVDRLAVRAEAFFAVERLVVTP